MRLAVFAFILFLVFPALADKRIIYTRPDGGVSIVVPAPEFVARFPNEAAAIVWIKANDIPVGSTNITEIDHTELPQRKDATDTLRDAWEWNNTTKQITINPGKTRPLPAVVP